MDSPRTSMSPDIQMFGAMWWGRGRTVKTASERVRMRSRVPLARHDTYDDLIRGSKASYQLHNSICLS